MKKNTFAAFVVAALFISATTYKSTSENTITLYSYQSVRGDAVVSKLAPNTNGGSSEDIYLYAWTQKGTLNVNRILLDFNTSEIPQNTVIKHAYLNLYFNPTSKIDKGLGGKGNKGGDSFKVEEITTEWNETTVTWTTQPTADVTTKYIGGKKFGNRSDYTNLDITELVQSIVNKPVDQRFGMRLKLLHEEPFNTYFFASGNHPNVAIRPSLQIEY